MNESDNRSKQEVLAQEFENWQKQYFDDVYSRLEKGDEQQLRIAFDHWEDRFLKFLQSKLPRMVETYQRQAGIPIPYSLQTFKSYRSNAVVEFLTKYIIEARNGHLDRYYVPPDNNQNTVVSVGGNVIGNIIIGNGNTFNQNNHQDIASLATTSDILFEAGHRVKQVRQEIDIKSSEFVEALGLTSEREYLAMENSPEEVPLSVLNKIHDLTGVSLEWLKHGKEQKYRVEQPPIRPMDKALNYISTFKPEKVFFTLGYTGFDTGPGNLTIGIVAQTGTYSYQLIDYGIALDFWTWVEDHWLVPLIYQFLSGAWERYEGSSTGIFIPMNISNQLFEGKIHFRTALRQSKGIYNYWPEAVLDIDYEQDSKSDYEKRYGKWITKVHEGFINIGGHVMLHQEFDRAMKHTYEVAKEHGYQPTYFKQMLDQLGGEATARTLLAKTEIQEGLMKLWELKLLDQSMEALVIQEHFQPLFTKEEIAEAHRRLEELGYFKGK